MLDIEFQDSADYAFDEPTRTTIASILNQADQDVRSHLPDLADRIHVSVASSADEVIPETGEMGTCRSADHIHWTANPWDERGIETIVADRLRSTFFHEAHHAVRHRLVERDTRLIGATVFEGLATVFERDAVRADPPYARYDPEVARGSIPELLAEPSDIPRIEWFVHHRDGRKWIVYRTGTYIVDRAIRRSGETAASLVSTPTDQVLQLAGLSNHVDSSNEVNRSEAP